MRMVLDDGFTVMLGSVTVIGSMGEDPLGGRTVGLRKRIDAFPTQLVLTFGWATLGLAACLIWRSSILLVLLMSWYAIVISHWVGHLAWRAKREAQQ